jgi:rhomboid protease GluP
MDERADQTEWTCIRRAIDRTPLADASLVLSAIDVDHAVERDGHEWGLFVPPAFVAQALAELETYHDENRPTVQRRPRVTIIDRGWVGVVGYLFIIWMLPTLEVSHAFGRGWRDGGEMQAGLVMAGQWWRTVTALTLHADLGHIVANSLFGAVFGVLVGRHFGSGFGWLLVVACGAIGNALDAAVQPDDFRSIGASTATFAAVGLVGGLVWRRGYYRASDWRRSFAPIFATIALLAYTGIGDERTDVVAHVTGLTTGLGCGIVAAGFDIRRLGVLGQYCAGAVVVGLVALAWWLAE